MFHKICLISFMLIFICLYLYVKIEHFDNPNSTISNIPISKQLTSEISRILSVSARRIINVNYSGDASSGKLMVSFIILEPNTAETKKQEPNATDAAKLAHQITSSGKFKVFINGMNVVLYKMPKPTTNLNAFFDNDALKEVSNYSYKKYISVPNDASLTNFFKLGFDSDFNIVPKLTPQTTKSSLPPPASSFA